MGARGWKGGRLEARGDAVMGQERCGGDVKKVVFETLSCV
jgi:hypothetical protein